ncbi:MAG: type II toxin-antitoxin system RelE/ParE family toxin [Oxalobacter formigenes]|nr:type II toxin-antitoxin system RelE/ParE family toxin [Oxalobacter formigenes]
MSKQDNAIQKRIVFRFAQIKENGYFGDSKSVGGGVFELRFHVPSGIRVYYGFRDEELIIVIGGGNKDSQQRDIAFAKQFFESEE